MKNKKYQLVSEKLWKILVDREIRIHHLWVSNRGDTAHICVVQDTNYCPLQLTKSALHAQNQENETKNFDNWIDYFPFDKLFSI